MFVKSLYCQKTYLIYILQYQRVSFCLFPSTLFSETKLDGVKWCMTSSLPLHSLGFVEAVETLWCLSDQLLVSAGIWDLNKKRGGKGGWLSCYLTFPTPSPPPFFFAGYCNFSAVSEFLSRNTKPIPFLTVPWH